MSHSLTAIEATRRTLWTNQSFYLWMTDDSLRGLHNHKSSPSFWATPFDLLPFVFDVGIFGALLGLILLIVTLPLMIIPAIIVHNKKKKADSQLDTLDANSDDYLGWDKHNFRLRLGDISWAEFFQPATRFSSVGFANNLHIHLENGEKWHFFINSSEESHRLRSFFEEKKVVTTFRPAKFPPHKLFQILTSPIRFS